MEEEAASLFLPCFLSLMGWGGKLGDGLDPVCSVTSMARQPWPLAKNCCGLLTYHLRLCENPVLNAPAEGLPNVSLLQIHPHT